jgi:hypothetical protein
MLRQVPQTVVQHFELSATHEPEVGGVLVRQTSLSLQAIAAGQPLNWQPPAQWHVGGLEPFQNSTWQSVLYKGLQLLPVQHHLESFSSVLLPLEVRLTLFRELADMV